MEESTTDAPETNTTGNPAAGLSWTGDSTGRLVVDLDASRISPDIDVVAVHGIHGNSKDTWASKEDSSTTWLTETMFDRLPWQYYWTRILKYSYRMDENDKGATYTGKGIRHHASQLIKDLLELREQGQIRRPIVFVAEDIGGIIVKDALHLASLHPAKFASITSSTVAMIFFQCPHRCSNPVDTGDGLARLLVAGGHGHARGIVGKVQKLVPWIIDVNRSFIDTNLLTKVTMVNVVSTVGDFSQRVFDRYTATLDLPFEIVVEIDRPHKDLTKAPPDESYGRRIGDILGRPPYLFLVDESLNDLLLNQAPPLRPMGPADQAQDQVEWISKNETFRKWQSEKAASILHVYGSSGVSAASKHIFDQMRTGDENESLLYYDFKLRDCRYNNMQAMLSTFVIQLVVHYLDDIQTPIAKNLEFLRHYRAWTNEDLYSFWMDLLHHNSNNAITCIINGFDQCTESRSWFLKKLSSTMDKWDRPFKVVLTSTGHRQEIQETLADMASLIDLNRPPEHHGIDTHGRRLTTDCQPAGLIYSDSSGTRERNLDKMISACGSDEPLQRLVIEWLKASNGTNEDRSIVDRLSNITSQSMIAPQKVLNKILSCVPPERQYLVRQAIAWVSSSFRPLIKAEFDVILALGEMKERPQELHEALRKMTSPGVIPSFLAGLFMLENNEVQFSHLSAADLFIDGKALPDNDWCIFERGAAHEVIAQSCLSYLSLPEIQIRMTTFYELKDQMELPPLVSEDYGLLRYAVTHWAQHYKHATVSERLSKQAIDFLKDSDAMTCWAKTYHALSNRVTRDDRPFSSALEVASGFGLKDLMAYFSNEMREAYSVALIAAARNNHTKAALEIFGSLAPTDSLTPDVIMAAASGGDESLLLTLTKHILSRTSEAFEWQSDLLARGAWLGWGDVVDKLIASGVKVNPLHPLHGMSPLHLAARNNQPDIVKALLQGKANINVRNESGAPPLHTASFYGHHEVVELLIKEGADLEAKQDDDQTALEVACTSGHGKVVESLTKASSRTHAQDPKFYGPLLWNAIQRGFITVCHVLLEAAPDLVDHYDDAECPLFVRAAATDNVALVELLAQRTGATIDVRWTSDRDEGTALYYAAQRGSKAMTECLLRLKADPKLSFYGNRTPIYIASHNGHAEVVQLLVDQEVDVNAVATGAWGPLQVAYDSTPVTRILLKAKAEVDHVSVSGTALYLASRWNHIEVVKALLEYDAGVDIPCPEGGYYHLATPLIAAVDNDNVEIARLLLEAGADVNYRKARRNFALQYAIRSEECMKALLEYSPLLDLVDDDGDTALHCVEAETSVLTIKRLLNAGANTEIANSMGYTPLCMAILNQNLPVVQYLISKKVRLDFTGGQRGGPLHLACHMASFECIKYLVNGGANVNLCDVEIAGTPLQAFCFCRADWSDEEEEPKRMIHFLIQAGANVNKRGGRFGYPLHAACLRRTPSIIKFLIDKGADILVEDGMGRNPAQLASLRTTEHVELFSAEEYQRLFSERDALGRSALHYAVVSGRLELVKRVYDLSGRQVDITDCDGWTPLMWAARACRMWGTSTFEQMEIIQFLKDEGANLLVRGEGLLNRGWSPLKVARYYEAPSEITKMLVPESKETWDSSFHLTNIGKAPGEGLYCDACLMGLWGIYFHCLHCRDYHLCFKCYRGRDIFHPNHPFREDGEETEREFDESEDDGEEDDFDEDEDEDGAEVTDDENPVSDGESGASSGVEKTGEQEHDGAINAGYDVDRVDVKSEGGAEAKKEQENNTAGDDNDEDDDNNQGAETDSPSKDTY